MAVVMEYKTAMGATVRIHDDCYINASPEEIQRRWDRIGEAIRMVDKNIRMQENAEKATGKASGSERRTGTKAKGAGGTKPGWTTA